MLEILFSENAANSLKVAADRSSIGETATAFSAILGGQPGKEELEKACRAARNQERAQWERAVILDVNPDDVYAFPLALSYGNILSPTRLPALRSLLEFEGVAGDAKARSLVEMAQKNLETVRRRMAEGEAVRIFYSSNADEACGLCWFLAQIQQCAPQQPVYLVPLLPHVRPEDAAVVCYDWGSVPPAHWGRLTAESQCRTSSTVLISAAQRWKALQEENSPLRVVLNGGIHSVPANFYDCFLRRELYQLPTEFCQADLMGRVISHPGLGIFPGFLAQRIQEMIADGELTVTSQPKPGEPSYKRMLYQSSLVHPDDNCDDCY